MNKAFATLCCANLLIALSLTQGHMGGNTLKGLDILTIRPILPQAASVQVIQADNVSCRAESRHQNCASLDSARDDTSIRDDKKNLKIHSAASSLLPVVNQSDIAPADQELLNAVFQWMPPLCRENLEHLIVQYDKDVKRGQSSTNVMLLRGGMPRPETIAVAIHECGHIMDLGGHRGDATSGYSNYPDGPTATYNDDPSVLFYRISWQDAWNKYYDAKEEDFVSGYALQDPWEDVAESIVYYALHERAFRKRASENSALAQKLEWVEAHIFGSDFETPESDIWDDGEIVWDITKMGHGLLF